MEENYHVYILQSLKDGNLYTGITNNLERRLYEHNLAYKNSTRGRAPFTIIYSEECNNRLEARQREKYFKSGIGREYIKKYIIPHSEVAQR